MKGRTVAGDEKWFYDERPQDKGVGPKGRDYQQPELTSGQDREQERPDLQITTERGKPEKWHKALGICSIILGLVSLVTIIGGFIGLNGNAADAAPAWFIAFAWLALASVLLAGTLSGFWLKVDQLNGAATAFVRGVGVAGACIPLVLVGYVAVILLIIVFLVAIAFSALTN